MSLFEKSVQSFFYYISRHKTALILTLIYAALISFISAHHEVWRDEVEALSTVIGSQSLVDAFINLRNYGHPYLWYLILYLAFKITHVFVVLKIMHILIAVSAIYIFLLKAPFDWFQKILFMFGYFPFYQYAVVNRDYVLGMFLLFLLCSLFKQRFKKSILFGIVVFFLANTVIHALIIALSVTLSWVAEYFYLRCKRSEEKDIDPRSFNAGILIALSGIVLSLICTWPNKTATQAVNLYHLDLLTSITTVIRAIAKPLVSPCETFSILFLHTIFSSLCLPVFFSSCVIWLLYAYLLRKPFILIIFLLSTMGIQLFFSLIYPGLIYHLGFLYLLIITALWMDAAENNSGKTLYRLPASVALRLPYFIFVFLATVQILLAYPMVIRDLDGDFSSSKRFGDFIKSHQEFKNAIILSEPDFFAEAMPYYVNNLIYIPREKRFGKFVKFTTENKQTYSLEELLNTAKKLQAAYHQPVLLMMGGELNPKGPFEMPIIFGRTFTYSKNSLNLFLKHTKKIAGFHQAYTDENYDIYLLPNGEFI